MEPRIAVEYYPAIESALLSVPSDIELSMLLMITTLHGHIVDSYNGDPVREYRRQWNKTIIYYLNLKGIAFVKTPKPSWLDICFDIADRLVSKGYDFQKQSSVTKCRSTSSPESNVSISKSEYASSTSSEAATTTDMPVKRVKLTEQDKQNIKSMYDGLNKTKMWKLSTGTLVEEQMFKLAISKDHEHLSHSLIMDVRDSCWKNYFSAAEIEEIRRYKAVQLPDLPADIKGYMDELIAIPRSELFQKLNEVTYAINTDRFWIQDTYNSCARLIKSGYFPLRDVTEQDMGRRMWSCVDKCFDFGDVRCVVGEKCSKASADAVNSVRSPSDYTRQQSGRKMDCLFKTKDSDIEIGCGECALSGGVNTTKQFQDAAFKMPKVMKDMLVKIVSTSPDLVHKLHICGLFIAAETLTLYILDTPKGHVTRYDSFHSVTYPIVEAKIRSKLPDVLTMIYSTRVLMEATKNIIDNDESKLTLGRDIPVVIEPCFVPVGGNYKKRKQ